MKNYNHSQAQIQAFSMYELKNYAYLNGFKAQPQNRKIPLRSETINNKKILKTFFYSLAYYTDIERTNLIITDLFNLKKIINSDLKPIYIVNYQNIPMFVKN